MAILRKMEVRAFQALRLTPPSSPLRRFTFWLLLGTLLCYALYFLGASRNGVFSLIVIIATVLLVPCLTVVLFGMLRDFVIRRVLWKLRNRLAVTYLLIGLAPLVLLVTLACIAAYAFAGQFAIFAFSTELDTRVNAIGTENGVLAQHIERHLQARNGALTSAEIAADMKGESSVRTNVTVYFDGQSVHDQGSSGAAAAAIPMPSWPGQKFLGVVQDGSKLHFRAIDRVSAAGHSVSIISSTPVNADLLNSIASGLGQASVFPTVHSAKADRKSGAAFSVGTENTSGPKSSIQVGGEQGDFSSRIVGGTLPSRKGFYDVPVNFITLPHITDWSTGKDSRIIAMVTSRPSLLYQRLVSSSAELSKIVRVLLISVSVIFAVVELVALWMGMRLSRTITRSVHDLYAATLSIDRGDLKHRIEVTRNDQLAELSKSFNRMTSSLERLLVEQKEKERLQNELSIAQEVQANLFPRGDVALPMLELHGVCRPARTVSGDYYDFLLFGQAGLGLAIGDISGKGISAALLMATLHSAVRAYRFAGEELVYAEQHALALGAHRWSNQSDGGDLFESPGRILSLLNRHLYRSTQPEKYATLFLAHYDGLKSTMTYSNGGQLPPLILHASGAVTRCDQGGTVVGLMDGMEYDEGSVRLASGDIFIGYSDGVTEPENDFGDFGEGRLVEIIQRHRRQPLNVISEQVMQALNDWIGSEEQPDDITLVLARQQ